MCVCVCVCMCVWCVRGPHYLMEVAASWGRLAASRTRAERQGISVKALKKTGTLEKKVATSFE